MYATICQGIEKFVIGDLYARSLTWNPSWNEDARYLSKSSQPFSFSVSWCPVNQLGKNQLSLGFNSTDFIFFRHGRLLWHSKKFSPYSVVPLMGHLQNRFSCPIRICIFPFCIILVLVRKKMSIILPDNTPSCRSIFTFSIVRQVSFKKNMISIFNGGAPPFNRFIIVY